MTHLRSTTSLPDIMALPHSTCIECGAKTRSPFRVLPEGIVCTRTCYNKHEAKIHEAVELSVLANMKNKADSLTRPAEYCCPQKGR